MKSRYLKHVKKRIGLKPGAIDLPGDKQQKPEHFHVFEYDCDTLKEFDSDNFPKIKKSLTDDKVTWINLNNVSSSEQIHEICDVFGVHPLILEDIMHVGQRPKCEYMGDYVFIVLKVLFYDKKKKQISSRQLSMLLFKNLLITFQELSGDVFEAVRERLRQKKGHIRKNQADYLAYALIDAVIDNYFLILEEVGDVMEEIEEGMMKNMEENDVPAIHRLKRNTIYLRKSVWPLREMINSLCRGEDELIREKTTIYLKDLYDHVIQVMDTVESFRDINSGLLDTYLSHVGNRMNEIMKGLTILASIFVPLTFIVGIYGMNFQYIPELKLKYGYFFAWGLMLIITVGMVVYFKKKRWI